jgi:hypothetical protein
MLDGLKRSIAARFLTSLLTSLATNKDTQTTVAGLLAGAVLGIKDLNLSALIAGDPHQVATLVSGLALWGIGYLCTKANRDGQTTLLGVLAAAAQASIGNFTAALTLGLTGYLTNKKAVAAPAPAANQEVTPK